MRSTWLAPHYRLSSLLLFLCVAAAPFPFGSASSVAIAFWCVILGIGAVALRPVNVRNEHLTLAAVLGAVVLAYAFVLHEQLATVPWLATPHPVWKPAAEAMQIALKPAAAINRDGPLLALGAPLANILALACSFFVCTDRIRAKQLFLVVAYSGAAYAVYAIAAYFLDPAHILWRPAPLNHALSGTFEYRSTAAVYFGLIAIVWLLLALDRMRQILREPDQWKSTPRLLLSELPLARFAMCLLCLGAVVMTKSRGGTVIALLALSLAITSLFYRDLAKRRLISASLVVGILIGFASLELMGSQVVERLQEAGFADQGRAEVYRSMLRLIADRPWVGSGLGTFAWSFPPYRSDASMWGIWYFAHSTPLELAGDMGIPLAAAVGGAWLVALFVLIRGVRTRRNDRLFPAAGLAVAALSLAHSCIDFSFQISGYSIVVFALVGAGLAQSFSRRGSDGNGSETRIAGELVSEGYALASSQNEHAEQ